MRIGRDVRETIRDGYGYKYYKGGTKKVKGVLDAATEESIVVDGTTLPMESINSVRPLIDF